MPNLNKVQLIGRLGKDPETRFTPSGTKVTAFSMAVNRYWRDADGEKKEATEWVNIETWGGLAETCETYLKKGSLVYIEGRLQTDRYEVEGETRYYTKVVASQMQMLDRKPEEGEPDSTDDEGEVPF
ncbi:MAG: single-stranded DNA-binding protein [Chloroflexota bacterium]|nr:single-stranded DNA-binding protein [Chloroflexota bacterium]